MPASNSEARKRREEKGRAMGPMRSPAKAHCAHGVPLVRDCSWCKGLRSFGAPERSMP